VTNTPSSITWQHNVTNSLSSHWCPFKYPHHCLVWFLWLSRGRSRLLSALITRHTMWPISECSCLPCDSRDATSSLTTLNTHNETGKEDREGLFNGWEEGGRHSCWWDETSDRKWGKRGANTGGVPKDKTCVKQGLPEGNMEVSERDGTESKHMGNTKKFPICVTILRVCACQ